MKKAGPSGNGEEGFYKNLFCCQAKRVLKVPAVADFEKLERSGMGWKRGVQFPTGASANAVNKIITT